MRRPPDQARSIAEYLPRGGHLAALLAAARRLEAIDRLLPGVLGLGEASGLRAVRVTARCVTLGTDAPGRAYRLRYARQALLDANRRPLNPNGFRLPVFCCCRNNRRLQASSGHGTTFTTRSWWRRSARRHT